MSLDDIKARLAALRSARPAEPQLKTPPTGGGETRSRAPWGTVLQAAKPPDAAGREGPPSSPAPVAAVPPGQAGTRATVGASREAIGGAGVAPPPISTAQEAAEVRGSPFELPPAKTGSGKVPRTISVNELKRDARRERQQLVPRLPYPNDVERPKTRGDCFGGERPCPFVSCRYHLYLDVTPKGSLVINRPDVDVADLKASCSLDVADQGPVTLEQVGAVFNLTRERARQVEQQALARTEKAFAPGEVKSFTGSCRAVSAFSGRGCKLPAHAGNVPHHDGRYRFTRCAEPGQTRFEEREAAEERARAVPLSLMEATS